MADAPSPPLGSHELAALHHRIADLEAALATQQQLTQALRATQDYASAIVETVQNPFLVLTPEFRVHSANPAFYQMFQVPPADTEGQRIYDLGNGQWDIPELRRLLEDILSANTVFNEYAVTHDFEQIGRRTMLLNARRLDALQLILLAIEDITVRQQAQDALRLHYELG